MAVFVRPFHEQYKHQYLCGVVVLALPRIPTEKHKEKKGILVLTFVLLVNINRILSFGVIHVHVCHHNHSAVPLILY